MEDAQTILYFFLEQIIPIINKDQSLHNYIILKNFFLLQIQTKGFQIDLYSFVL